MQAYIQFIGERALNFDKEKNIFFAKCLGAILEYEIIDRLGRVENVNGVDVRQRDEGRGRGIE